MFLIKQFSAGIINLDHITDIDIKTVHDDSWNKDRYEIYADDIYIGRFNTKNQIGNVLRCIIEAHKEGIDYAIPNNQETYGQSQNWDDDSYWVKTKERIW